MTRLLIKLPPGVMLEAVDDGQGGLALLLTMPPNPSRKKSWVIENQAAAELAAALLAYLWGNPTTSNQALAQFAIARLVEWRKGTVDGREMAELLKQWGLVSNVHEYQAKG